MLTGRKGRAPLSQERIPQQDGIEAIASSGGVQVVDAKSTPRPGPAYGADIINELVEMVATGSRMTQYLPLKKVSS